MNGAEMTPLELPELLLAGLLGWAVVAYMLRTWQRVTCLAAALLTGGIGLWLWLTDLAIPLRALPFTARELDLTGPMTWGGFTFQLQSGAIPVITTSLLLTAVACLIAALINQGPPGFAALALLLVTGYVGLALLTTGPIPAPLLAPLFVAMLAGISVFVLQAGRYATVAGPLRMLIPPMLAFPLFLAAYWYIDQIPLNPQDATAQHMAARLIAFGLLLLLAPVPLHGAQPATAQASSPFIYALVILLYQLALLHLVFRTLLAFPFVGDGMLYEWLGVAGLATAVWGGVAATGANHPGRLWGYTALHDWGVILLVLAVPGLRSWLLVLFLFSLRAISMMTAATGLTVLEAHLSDLTPAKLHGVAARLPWNSAAFLVGGLGLAGFPLSAGFTGHWAALQLLAETDWVPAAIVLFAASGAIFSFIRLARNLYGPLGNRQLLREGMVSTIFAILVLIISVGLAVAPQWLDSPITRTLTALRS